MVALGTFAVIFVFEKFFKRAPAPLMAIGLGTAASAYFALNASGVSVVGDIPGGFPNLTLPAAELALEMWPAAAGIALMSFMETITSARAFAPRGSPRPDSNQELVAVGAGNIVGGLFGAMPTGGGTSQTNVNVQAGAKTQAAELVTAGLTLATMLFLAPVLAPMPNATLAAVVIAYSIGLISPAEIKAIRDVRTQEFRWAIAAMVGVLLLGTLKGILVAVLLSMAGLLARANNPRVDVLRRKPGTNVFRAVSSDHPGDESFPGLAIVKTEGRMYFANAPVVGERLREIVDREKPKVLALDSARFPNRSHGAQDAGRGGAALRSEGVELWLVSLNPEALEMVQRTPLAQALGHGRCSSTSKARWTHGSTTTEVKTGPFGAGAGARYGRARLRDVLRSFHGAHLRGRGECHRRGEAERRGDVLHRVRLQPRMGPRGRRDVSRAHDHNPRQATHAGTRGATRARPG
jgi:MFS superfamily sulfate permease-like transporter